MTCYKNGGCGIYEMYSCSECPASRPEYLNKNESEATEITIDCKFCQYPFKHCAKYYIQTGYSNDPYLYTLRKEDSVGGVMIEYCPWCGRKLGE